MKDAWLAEIRKSNPVLFNTVLVQAQRIDLGPDRIVLAFAASQKIGPAFDKYRPLLEETASRIAKRKVAVAADHTVQNAPTETSDAPAVWAGAAADAGRESALREQALADAGVQTLLEVFPAELRDIEEM